MRRFLLVATLLITWTGSAWAWNNDAERCAKGEGDLDGVIATCTRAISSGDLSQANRAITFYNRGRAYNAKGEPDRAIADHTEAIRLRPDFATAFYNRGLAYRAKGEPDRAIADHTEAIRLRPDFATAFNSRGLAYGRRRTR